MSLHQDPTQTAVRRQKRSLWTDAWRRMRRSHTAVIGMILFALIVIVCFSAPLFSDYDAQVINSDLAMIRKYPVEGHPLGTDELGRDLLLRILWGGRKSITIALAATVVSSVLGIILGAIPAYYGGATDSIIMRTLDVFMAIPSMLLMDHAGQYHEAHHVQPDHRHVHQRCAKHRAHCARPDAFGHAQ